MLEDESFLALKCFRFGKDSKIYLFFLQKLYKELFEETFSSV